MSIDKEGYKDTPDGKHVSASQLLLIGTGLAPKEDDTDPCYRPLSVDRSDIEKLWPLLLRNINTERKEVDSPSSPPKPPRKKREPEEIRQAARDVYAESPDDPPNIPRAEREIRKRLPGADRATMRKILHEPEFEVRKPPGNQRRR